MAMGVFPLGISSYALGGLFVGLGVSLIFLLTGLHAGASGFFSSTLSFFSKKPYFQQSFYRSSRLWRLIFSIGLIMGAVFFTFAVNGGTFFVTQVQWWRLAVGGFLIGFGTRLSRGCTSGHGICGLASLSLPSFLAVVTFLIVAILTAFVVSLGGVSP